MPASPPQDDDHAAETRAVVPSLIPLNIKNAAVERLVDKPAAHTGESRTEAVRRALEERLARMYARAFRRHRRDATLAWLREEVWPSLPEEWRGRPVTREEEARMLGYGPWADVCVGEDFAKTDLLIQPY